LRGINGEWITANSFVKNVEEPGDLRNPYWMMAQGLGKRVAGAKELDD